jgi:hypothetical protein
MQRIQSVKSSWVKQLAYDTKERSLAVRTKSDTVFIYNKVAPRTFTKLVNAESIGKAVSEFMQSRVN